MADESQQYSQRAIRQLLLTAFSAEELQDLLYFSKTPELREVPNQFAPGDSYPTMVRKAVRYCASRYLLGELLAEVKEANPRAYEKLGGTLHVKAAAAAPSQAQPKWLVPGLASVAAVIVITLAVLLALHPWDPDGSEPTEAARITETPTPTGTLAATYTPMPPPFTPTVTASPSPTAGDTEPQAGRMFIVVYYGEDRVSLYAGPGTRNPVRETLDPGTLLKVDAGPEIVGDVRWWPVHTDEQWGWVPEWYMGIRRIKPVFEVGDAVEVSNPTGAGNVDLWADDCGSSVVLSRGTALEVIGGPDLHRCGGSENMPLWTLPQWWQVETGTGERGWLADFGIWSGDGSAQAMLVAPRWYVELTEQ